MVPTLKDSFPNPGQRHSNSHSESLDPGNLALSARQSCNSYNDDYYLIIKQRLDCRVTRPELRHLSCVFE